jgi:hypothetical protein
MSTQKSSRRVIARDRIKRIWSELDYANRRMFAIRTGQYSRKGQSRTESRGRAPRRTAVAGH